MSIRNGPALVGAAALVLALAAPVGAQGPTVEVVVDGLAAPRGIDIGRGGAIFIAEAGAAGDECMGEGEGPGGRMCFGLTGGVTRIRPNGDVGRIVDGLPSVGAGPEILGVSDVALGPDDGIFLVMNSGGDPADREAMPPDLASYAGWLVRGVPGAGIEPWVDVAAHESTADPDGEFGGVVDANPWSIAVVDGGVVVADAGANALLMVADDGTISTVAVFPPTEHLFPAEMLAAMGGAPEGEMPAEAELPSESAMPAEGEMVPLPVESVPTSVVVGPDGAYYVGELTGGPFPVGGASVWRVTPEGEVSEYATGFTNIIDIAFGPDGTLYVAEIVHEGAHGRLRGRRRPGGRGPQRAARWWGRRAHPERRAGDGPRRHRGRCRGRHLRLRGDPHPRRWSRGEDHPLSIQTGE
ncbi:hypothetical protein BH23CHL8_BH23CHL8_09210 [soil metagenome]